jgi:hypothetical protein
MTSISFLPNTQGSMITESSVLYFCEVTRDDPSAHDRTPEGTAKWLHVGVRASCCKFQRRRLSVHTRGVAFCARRIVLLNQVFAKIACL